MTVEDVAGAHGDLIEHRCARGALEATVVPAPQRRAQTRRRIVEGVVVAAFDAAVAGVHGVVDVADEACDTPVLKGRHQTAGGVAETADGGNFGHGDLAAVRPRGAAGRCRERHKKSGALREERPALSVRSSELPGEIEAVGPRIAELRDLFAEEMDDAHAIELVVEVLAIKRDRPRGVFR